MNSLTGKCCEKTYVANLTSMNSTKTDTKRYNRFIGFVSIIRNDNAAETAGGCTALNSTNNIEIKNINMNA